MVAVIGGGISGLATAYYLKKRQVPFTLYEASPTLGGIIQSREQDGSVFEFGPNSLRDKTGILLDIVKDLSLEDKLITISEASKTRYIVKDGRLNALKGSPFSILSTKLLTPKGKLSLFGEIFKSPKKVENESVGQFLERRFGKEVTNQLADPVFTGIYAGDIYNLNKKLVLGEFAEYEHKYGSLIRGFIKSAKKLNTPKVFSFKGGLTTLVQAISDAVQENIKYESVENIRFEEGKVQLYTKSGSNTFTHVISTTPSYRLAPLIKGLDSNFSIGLEEIEYSPIAAIILSYKRSALNIPEDGFGFLIPSNEKRKLLGAIWRTSIFPELVHPEKYVFNLMIGGAKNVNILDQSESEVIEEALFDFNEILGISKEPLNIEFKLWNKGIPQYSINHHKILNNIDRFEQMYPNISIGGNFRWGVSVPDCISGAKKLVESLPDFYLESF